MAHILHLALPDDWTGAQEEGQYTMSTRGVTLEQEGFIHCSYPSQVDGVANRFYADVDELVLLTIDTERLAAGVEVIDEPPFPGSPERFPHIYGSVVLDAVVSQQPQRRGADGWTIVS